MSKDSFCELIRSRRSIRRYQERAVPIKKIRHILSMAAWAPSAHNSQPWRFIVIADKRMKTKLATKMAEGFERDLKKDGTPENVRTKLANASIRRFTEAPVVIIPCLNMREMKRYLDKRQKWEHTMGIQSVSAAINTLLLCAHAEGFGTCWYCSPLFCKEDVRKSLGIPKDIDPQALVTMGYAAERPARPLRKTVDEITYLNKWGSHPKE
jgi:coenzyme F420-0:L-glutamate ligase/coenzyme F420-1:gamma-L-glutamate ligase